MPVRSLPAVQWMSTAVVTGVREFAQGRDNDIRVECQDALVEGFERDADRLLRVAGTFEDGQPQRLDVETGEVVRHCLGLEVVSQVDHDADTEVVQFSPACVTERMDSV